MIIPRNIEKYEGCKAVRLSGCKAKGSNSIEGALYSFEWADWWQMEIASVGAAGVTSFGP